MNKFYYILKVFAKWFWNLSKTNKFIVLSVMFFLGLAIFRRIENHFAEKEFEAYREERHLQAVVYKNIQDSIKNYSDSIKKIPPTQEQINALLKIDMLFLESKIKEIKNWDPKNYSDNLFIGVKTLESYANDYTKYKVKNKIELNPLLDKYKRSLQDKQKSSFPKLRQYFGLQLNDKLWEENMSARVSGTTIFFTGGTFANNKNIKNTHIEILDNLTKFRFKRACYLWYKGQDDYIYYDINSKKDTDL